MTIAVVRELADSPAVLCSAAELIETNGLHKWDGWPGAFQGYEWKPGIPLCTLAALTIACGKTDIQAIKTTPAIHAVIAYLTGNANAYAGLAVGADRYTEISNWSDSPDTTTADVVGVLRKVADIETARIAASLPVAAPELVIEAGEPVAEPNEQETADASRA